MDTGTDLIQLLSLITAFNQWQLVNILSHSGTLLIYFATMVCGHLLIHHAHRNQKEVRKDSLSWLLSRNLFFSNPLGKKVVKKKILSDPRLHLIHHDASFFKLIDRTIPVNDTSEVMYDKLNIMAA